MKFNININTLVIGYIKCLNVTLFKHFCLIVFVLIIILIPSNLSNNEVDENDLVIAYLERFTRFIVNEQHPEFDDKDNTFNICVFGDNIFGERIGEAYKLQKVKNRVVKVSFAQKTEDIKDANLIFISLTSKSKIKKIIEFANQRGILTTSYSSGFAAEGVHINIFKQNKRLRFEINLKSANSAGFSISHLLLSNAIIVE